MVAPSQKNPPKISVQTFARSSAKVTPASGRVKTDRAAAEVWGAVSETIAADFTQLARAAVANAWYTALSSEESRHWLDCYDSDVTVVGLPVRRIPRQVTEELAVAIERDCFTEYVVWTNAKRQFVLLGVRETHDEHTVYPIVAWYPTKSPLPTSEELKEMFDAKLLALKHACTEADNKRRAAAAQAEEARRQVRALGRTYWIVASAVFGVMNLVTLCLSWKWGVGSLFVTAIGAWLVLEVNDGFVDTTAAVHKRLFASFAVLCTVVGALLVAAARS